MLFGFFSLYILTDNLVVIVKDITVWLGKQFGQEFSRVCREKPVQESSTASGVGNTVQEMSTCDVWDSSPELMAKITAGGFGSYSSGRKYR